jgi:hypothetical protein
VSYGLIAAAWAALAVLRVQSGSGPSLWVLLPIAAYAAGLAYGTAQLRPLPGSTGALRLILAHAVIGALGTLSLLTLNVGLVVVPIAMLAAAILSLLLPRVARGSDAYIVSAFAGAGWLVLGLLLLG